VPDNQSSERSKTDCADSASWPLMIESSDASELVYTRFSPCMTAQKCLPGAGLAMVRIHGICRAGAMGQSGRGKSSGS
jgi:hypothetical protein